MIREETVFGPIHSRRLGSSLGINLLPRRGKFCTFDCIYCECGWNKDGLEDQVLPTAAEVRSALEDKLAACLLDGIRIDSITFSGDGEPTLNPEFPRIIDDTLKLRDAYFPSAKVSVLSNATRVHVPAIAAALKRVDNPILKIDAPTDASWRPCAAFTATSCCRRCSCAVRISIPPPPRSSTAGCRSSANSGPARSWSIPSTAPPRRRGWRNTPQRRCAAWCSRSSTRASTSTSVNKHITTQ